MQTSPSRNDACIQVQPVFLIWDMAEEDKGEAEEEEEEEEEAVKVHKFL